jgi:flagellar hook-basal body complex protein FliE
MRQYAPKQENLDDVQLLESAAAALRAAWLELEQVAKKAQTSTGENAFDAVLNAIENSVDELTGAAKSLDENAVQDAADDAADRTYDDMMAD